MDYSLREAKKGMSWMKPASSEVGCSQPAALLDFLSPHQVVCPGFFPSHTLDKILQVPPETQLLQRVVKPTCSDAEVSLVWGDVVDAVVLARKDDVPVLQ